MTPPPAPDRLTGLTDDDWSRLTSLLAGVGMHHDFWHHGAFIARANAALAALRAEAASLQERLADGSRVHLSRHTRLAEALGMDPGFSVDATIDEAIRRLAKAPRPEPDYRALTGCRHARHEACANCSCGECGQRIVRAMSGSTVVTLPVAVAFDTLDHAARATTPEGNHAE